MLENFGLRVINERPYEVVAADGEIFGFDFLMTVKDAKVENLADCQAGFNMH